MKPYRTCWCAWWDSCWQYLRAGVSWDIKECLSYSHFSVFICHFSVSVLCIRGTKDSRRRWLHFVYKFQPPPLPPPKKTLNNFYSDISITCLYTSHLFGWLPLAFPGKALLFASPPPRITHSHPLPLSIYTSFFVTDLSFPLQILFRCQEVGGEPG